MAAVARIPAGDVKVGDHIARTKREALDGDHHPVTEIRDGQTSRRISIEGEGNIRPKRTTKVWVMLESDDPRAGGDPDPEQSPTETSTAGMTGEGPDAGASDQVADREETDATLTRTRAALKKDRGITIDTVELDGEQMARALELTAGERAGLRGKAAKQYILEGTTLAEQADEAQAARQATNGRQAPRGPKPGSMTSAMLEVMKPMRTPATAKQVTEKILSKGLAPGLKGKTPDATVGAKLSTEAAKPDGLFERVAPGQYKVRRETAGAGK